MPEEWSDYMQRSARQLAGIWYEDLAENTAVEGTDSPVDWRARQTGVDLMP